MRSKTKSENRRCVLLCTTLGPRAGSDVSGARCPSRKQESALWVMKTSHQQEMVEVDQTLSKLQAEVDARKAELNAEQSQLEKHTSQSRLSHKEQHEKRMQELQARVEALEKVRYPPCFGSVFLEAASLRSHSSPGANGRLWRCGSQELVDAKEAAADAEALGRKHKNKVRYELNAIVSRYDTEMGKRQEEIDAITSECVAVAQGRAGCCLLPLSMVGSHVCVALSFAATTHAGLTWKKHTLPSWRSISVRWGGTKPVQPQRRRVKPSCKRSATRSKRRSGTARAPKSSRCGEGIGRASIWRSCCRRRRRARVRVRAARRRRRSRSQLIVKNEGSSLLRTSLSCVGSVNNTAGATAPATSTLHPQAIEPIAR